MAFGVNPSGAESHAKFRDRHKLPFPLLIDEGKRVAVLYKTGGLLFVTRTVYLIGPDGRIAYAKRGMPSPDDVIKFAK